MPRLEYSDLSELFYYDWESGQILHLRNWGKRKVGDIATFPVSSGYLCVSAGSKQIYAHRLAWYLATGAHPVEQIDHINQDRHDNRWVNLREASNGQNAMNRKKLSNNTSGFKNVHLHKASGLWRARVRRKGREVIGGYFTTPEEASAAAERLRLELHEEFRNA